MVAKSSCPVRGIGPQSPPAYPSRTPSKWIKVRSGMAVRIPHSIGSTLGIADRSGPCADPSADARERRIHSAAGKSYLPEVASHFRTSVRLVRPGRRTRRAIRPGRAVCIARSAKDRDLRPGRKAATTPRGRSPGRERMEHRGTEPRLLRPGPMTVRLPRWRSGAPARRPCAPRGLREKVRRQAGRAIDHNTAVCHCQNRTYGMGTGEQGGTDHKTTRSEGTTLAFAPDSVGIFASSPSAPSAAFLLSGLLQKICGRSGGVRTVEVALTSASGAR
jgi:hypothetical protein